MLFFTAPQQGSSRLFPILKMGKYPTSNSPRRFLEENSANEVEEHPHHSRAWISACEGSSDEDKSKECCRGNKIQTEGRRAGN